MVLLRLVALNLVGLGFAAILAWLTSLPFALYCVGAVMAGVYAHQSKRAPIGALPPWASAPIGRVLLQVVGVACLVTPLLIGLVWFRWWWGFAGFPLGALGAGFILPSLPGPARLLLGLVLCAAAALWLGQ